MNKTELFRIFQPICLLTCIPLIVIFPRAYADGDNGWHSPKDATTLDKLIIGYNPAWGPEALVAQSGNKDSRHSVLADLDGETPEAIVRKTLHTKIRKLENQLSSQQKALADREAAEKNNAEQISTLHRQLDDAAQIKSQLESTLQIAQSQLKQSNINNAPPSTDNQRQAYVVGQAMAASLQERLSSYRDAGLPLDINSVANGLSDGIHNHMQIKPDEMDQAWQTFANELQKQVAERVKQSEAVIAAASRTHQPVKSVNGITYWLIKKGESIDANAPRTLSVTESVQQGGRKISDVPQLTLSPDDDMPEVVREALPLLGPGAHVEASALAKTIYGDRPLPAGVSPFTILTYSLKGLNPT